MVIQNGKMGLVHIRGSRIPCSNLRDLGAEWVTDASRREAEIAQWKELAQAARSRFRFIVDLFRSGIDGLVKAGERIVLPRGHGLITAVLNLWETAGFSTKKRSSSFRHQESFPLVENH